MNPRHFLPAALGCAALGLAPMALRAAESGFAFTQTADRLVITHAGQPVATYVLRDDRILRPHFIHLHAPGGLRVTRNHPPVPGRDATDHDTMHPGLWLAFGDLSGHDFWRNRAIIRHERFTEPPAVRDGRLTFATENLLMTTNGQPVCAQLSRITLAAEPAGYRLIWEAIFRADHGDFYFGDQEEMGLGVRVATAITEKNGGTITSSTGLKTAKATWGKAFDWCDYSGVIGGRCVGVRITPDPANFRPSWFHNRDYGLMVANPFGRKAMNQGDTSRVVVKQGEQFRLRFDVWLRSEPAGPEAEPARPTGFKLNKLLQEFERATAAVAADNTEPARSRLHAARAALDTGHKEVEHLNLQRPWRR